MTVIDKKTINILFVCLGNICRSPTAEAIMNHIIKKQGLQEKIICDSAGVSRHHAGQPANATMRYYAKQKGYTITSISRPIEHIDFKHFHWIVTMDDSNFKDVCSIAKTKEEKQKVLKISHFNSIKSPIPDPYRGESEGFLTVISLLEESCMNLLQKLKEEL